MLFKINQNEPKMEKMVRIGSKYIKNGGVVAVSISSKIDKIDKSKLKWLLIRIQV